MKITVEQDIVTANEEHNIVFKKGETFEFLNRVNVIVGRNGSGKTTLLKEILAYYIPPKRYGRQHQHVSKISIDTAFDKVFKLDTVNDDLLLTNNSFSALDDIDSFVMMYRANNQSHGESSMMYLDAMIRDVVEYKKINKEANILIVLDEVDKGFDFYMQCMLSSILTNVACRNTTVLFATHGYFNVKDAKSIYDLSNRAHITPEQYIKNIQDYLTKS